MIPFALGLLLAAGACNVDRDQTPHKKDLVARRKQLRKIRDAAVPPPLPAAPRAKVVVVAIEREPRHLNPALKISPWGYRIAMHTIFEPLLRRDPKTLEPKPHLVTEWTRSPNGRVYRFSLRKDVTWHDGKPFTSRDVWYSLNRIHDRGTNLGPFRMDMRNQFHQVDTLGPYAVRVTLAAANSYFLDHLCEYPMIPYHQYKGSIHRGHRANRRPVGTGPFRLRRWIRSREIQLVPNKRYWGDVPQFEALHFRLIANPAKALTDLKRGVVDILPKISREHYPEQITAWARRRFREVWFEPPGFNYIVWNTRHPLLADFRVRRALIMFMNRERIVREVHNGLAREVAGPFWHRSGLGDPKLKPWPYDPVRARNLLDNAGWRDRDGDKIRDLKGKPLRIVLLRPVNSAVMDDELKIISAELKRSGVDLVPVQTDWRMMRRLLRSRRFMAAALAWHGRPLEDMSPILHSAGVSNFGMMGSLMVDRLVSQMRTALGRQVRALLSRQLEKILWTFQPAAFIHGPKTLALVHRRLANLRADHDWFRFDKVTIVPFHDPTWAKRPTRPRGTN